MKHIKIITGLAFLTLLGACAADRHETNARPEPPVTRLPGEELRASLGTIMISSAQDRPEKVFPTPLKKGTGGPRRSSGGYVGDPFALILFLPIAIVVKAAATAAEAEPSESAAMIEEKKKRQLEQQKREQIEEQITELIRSHNLQTKFRNCIAKAATGLVPKRVAVLEAGAVSQPHANPILKAAVHSMGFQYDSDGFADLVFFLNLQASLRRDDGTPLYAHTLSHVSPPRPYSEWAAKNGALISSELDLACRRFGERIVEEVFLLWQGPSEAAVQ